jgi:hypothetical protein
VSEQIKFTVSSRASKEGSTHQVTIPAAIGRKLPSGKSIRWEVSVVEGGLFYRYLGQGVAVDATPEIDLPFVPDEEVAG